MIYMPPNEPRCCAQRCSLATSCARHQCPPGGPHPVQDFSIHGLHFSCGSFVELHRWAPPKAAKAGPKVHDHPGGLL